MGAQDLRPDRGATHSKKRVGRGNGSGHGTYSGKGLKGQKSRSGKNLPYDSFEGGQFPSARKFHVLRGFNNKWKVEYQPVNLGALERFADGTAVTPETLRLAGIIKNVRQPVKILGDGDFTKRLTVSAQKFSATAAEKIAGAGGTATIIAAAGKD
ncbi:MAG: 50S ribosomal protein L15 [Chloroflexi bacterium]|nr:50S ribosomal protein L15 [Chloroflexota bacterium]